MGNTRSEFFEPVDVDLWWDDGRSRAAEQKPPDAQQKKLGPAKMAEINEEISELHQRRLKLIADKKREMEILREEATRQRKENDQLREILRKNGLEPPAAEDSPVQQSETYEVPGPSKDAELIESLKLKNLELEAHTDKLQKDLQKANSELASFENERQEYKSHVTALKDIITISKQLLLMREGQIKELSQKVMEIQQSLAEREIQAFSQDLRQEYERQLQSIKQLRALYEERQRMDKTEKDNLKTQLDEATTSLKAEEDKNSELEARVEELEKENWKKYDSIVNLESQLGLTKAECCELRAEMSVINQLFSQILLGFNSGQEIDLDKLIRTLEENHDLLTEIIFNEESNELCSALPKVLLDLVNQVSSKTKAEESCSSQEDDGLEHATATLSTIPEESESQTSTAQQNSLNRASEIVQNLPKVWKVLAELLSHQSGPANASNENIDQSDKNPCYKSVQTPTGPALVLSVSKTFIRLKNLIVEKKSLEKETTRLKQLNTHLETRLQDQEKRLELVSHELAKTWHVVGKMQKQHQQLHTQEKILRYELAQKRKLLNELKEELEYCREKWLQAREKNSTTEEQWKQLRNEFASRKNTIGEDLNNSVESGYSDERESSSDDDEEASRPGQSADLNSAVSENLVNELTEGLANADEVESLKDEVVNSEVLADEVIGVVANELPLSESDIENVDIRENCTEDTSEASTSHCNNNSVIIEEEEQNTTTQLLERGQNLATDGKESTGELHSGETLKTDLVQNQEVSELGQEDQLSKPEELDTNQSVEDAHVQHEDDRGSRRKEVDDMYRKLEENILQTIKKTQSGDEFPSTSRQVRSAEEILRAREERLNRLEQESSQLVNQTARASHRSHEIISKLDSLHKLYGSQSHEEQPSTSSAVALTPEEILARREERLQRMEEQAQELVKKAIKNSWRGLQFCSKLNKLHDRYGESSDDDAADSNNNVGDGESSDVQNAAGRSDEEDEASEEHKNEEP